MVAVAVVSEWFLSSYSETKTPLILGIEGAETTQIQQRVKERGSPGGFSPPAAIESAGNDFWTMVRSGAAWQDY